MTTELYLDTARFGRMGPKARRAHADFLRLCGDEGGSAHVEELLVGGIDIWPDRMKRRYRGLSPWRGVSRFKDSLATLASAPPGTEVLLSHRSAQLMRLAARALFRRAHRVLHTDLDWPGYLVILEGERRRARAEAVCVPVREAVYRDGITDTELARMLATQYRARRCDGLFLSAVSYEGVRLPVGELVRMLSIARPPRFVVVDGAQALGHVPPGLEPCDLYLAGGHKWLQAGHPLGLGLCPRRGSQDYLRTTCRDMIDAGELDDPLLLLTLQLEQGALEPFGETVDLASLVSGAAAVSDVTDDPAPPESRFEGRLKNAEMLVELAAGTPWQPLLPAPQLRSGILLLRAERPEMRSAPRYELRRDFQREGIALTSYPDGLVRLSMPPCQWRPEDLERIRQALRRCS